jgi:hypothetical protein
MSKKFTPPNQPDLFSDGGAYADVPVRDSPSEAFKAAHPDFVESAATDRIVDPANRRVAERTATTGGGIAALYRGELERTKDKQPVTDTDSSPDGTENDSELNLRSSDAALQHRIGADTRRRGISAVDRIKKQQGWS